MQSFLTHAGNLAGLNIFEKKFLKNGRFSADFDSEVPVSIISHTMHIAYIPFT